MTKAIDTSESLDPELARLLIHLESGWSPNARRYASPVAVQWGDVALPSSSSHVVEEGSELVVRVEGAPSSVTTIHGVLGDQRTLTMTYADGFVLEAPRAFLFSQSMGFGDSPRERTVKIRASTWCVRVPELQPAYWLLPLGEEVLDGPGNLLIEWRATGASGGGSVSAGHFALRGRHRYFVVEQRASSRKAQWLVIPAERIDVRSPSADLFTDFVALQYLAGRRVCARRMFGVLPTLEVVAEAGVHLGQQRVPRTETAPPVPLRTARRPYVVPFFAALSEALAKEPDERTTHRIALVWSTEATSDTYIDGRLLRLGAALRALLRGDATDVESSSTVAEAEKRLAESGAPVSESTRTALRATDGLMATGLLPEYGSDFIEKHLAHVDEIRRVIAQIVASWCGYRGPLGRSARFDATGETEEEAGDGGLVIESAIANAELPARPTTIEWGDFGLVEPSEVKALAPVVQMAEVLERHTDGRVAGRLRWSARSDEDTTWFDLEAFVARDPRTHVPLASFGYREEAGVIVVRTGVGPETSYTDRESLVARLVELGKSVDVKKAITSLLGLDQALGAR